MDLSLPGQRLQDGESLGLGEHGALPPGGLGQKAEGVMLRRPLGRVSGPPFSSALFAAMQGTGRPGSYSGPCPEKHLPSLPASRVHTQTSHFPSTVCSCEHK